MRKYSCLLLSLMLLLMTGCRSGENSSSDDSGSSQPPITEVTYDDGILVIHMLELLLVQ